MSTARKILITVISVIVGLPVLLILSVLAVIWYFDTTNGSVISGGESRDYLLHVPDSVDRETPVPLVISLHAAFLMPVSQRRYTEWNAVADEHGFIVVYPGASGFPRLWRLQPGDGLEKEARFMSDLIDHLQSKFAIDTSRIYINGYSNGAAMTFLLSCELADRVAAIGTVSMPVLDWSWCTDKSPMPLIAFQGDQDMFIPYEGGTNLLTDVPMQSVEQWVKEWGRRNECADQSEARPVAIDVTLTRYYGCVDNKSVVLYTIVDGGHTWPGVPRMPEAGAGKTTESVHASELMWTFFQQFRLP